MQRIFAFDPGTAALGWAVIDHDRDGFEIRACGVRLYGLVRQRILDSIKQRLKPQDRVKARQRRRMRLRKLDEILHISGLAARNEVRSWRTGNGTDLQKLIGDATDKPVSSQSLVRIVHNVHSNRGSCEYGPQAMPIQAYLEKVLLAQARWHPTLADPSMRVRIADAVFHQRSGNSAGPRKKPRSRLATVAADEMLLVWNDLASEFGEPDLTVIEAAFPQGSGRQQKEDCHDTQALDLLRSHNFPATPRRILRARVFLRQADTGGEVATCDLTGQSFTFQAAMSEGIEIDHVLPKSRGGPGGRANLRLVFAHANRSKGSGPGPTETVSRNPAGIPDSDSLRQTLTIVRSRFEVLARSRQLLFIPSRRVAALRKAFFPRFGTKDRSIQLHHVADALVTGLAAISRGRAALDNDASGMLETALMDARLSVRTERSRYGRLHEDTRYGLPAPESGYDPESHVVTRKAVDRLTPAMMRRIADPALRRRMENPGETAPFARAKRVKVVVPATGHIRLHDSDGAFMAAVLPADNHHMDIVQMRDGRWKTYTATRHERNRPGWRPEWEINRTGGKLVMRLHKGDMIEWASADGKRELLVVARLSGSSGVLHLGRPLSEGGSGQLVAAAASTLKKRLAKAMETTPSGRRLPRRSNAL